MSLNVPNIVAHFDRIRRFLFTAILYGVFGLGAVILSLFVIFPVAMLSWNRQKRMSRVRYLNKLAFSSFTRVGVWVRVFDVKFENEEKLDIPGQVIISNHPSLLDVVFLLGRVPKANCVVKKKLLKNPFLALPVYFADYILNDDGIDMLHQCRSSIQNGESVVIFPEGTRTSRTEQYSFQRGASYLMLENRCLVRPIYISCLPIALGKKDAWYSIPRKKITYLFSVLDNLELNELRTLESMKPPLKSRRLTAHLLNWYRGMDKVGPYSFPENISFASKVK